MDSIYFAIFCLAIGYVIFWSLKNDDIGDFGGGDSAGKKFTLRKKGEPKDSGKENN